MRNQLCRFEEQEEDTFLWWNETRRFKKCVRKPYQNSVVVSRQVAVRQTQVKNMEVEKKKKRRTASWSTQMPEEVASEQECEDTEEMRQWRHVSQERRSEMWKELCGKMEEEVLERLKMT